MAGLTLGLLLLVRWFCAPRKATLALLAGYLLLALALAWTFLPCFSLSNAVLCRGPSNQKWIALTLDDGPNEPFTSQVLDILKQRQVHATFFLVGREIVRSPKTVERMLREGHAISNHTETHRPLVWRSRSAIQEELTAWEAAIAPLHPTGTKLFRSPHGWKDPWLPGLLKQRDYRWIGWTLGVWDSDRPGVELLNARLRELPNGSILLLHDGDGDHPDADRSQTVAVLPKLIDDKLSQGFQFVTIPEMFNF